MKQARLTHISIHAPPRGATFAELVVLAKINYFNSRPSARGDAAVVPTIKPSMYFNSRPSARGDPCSLLLLLNCGVISIHAPPRGATLAIRFTFFNEKFQFTPLREGRLFQYYQRYLFQKLFQFTPLREGRHQ